MYPWDQLGIEPTQDVRAIKRAYGKLLQTHRPDEDQQAFEELRQAYEAALSEVQPRAETPLFAPLQPLDDGRTKAVEVPAPDDLAVTLDDILAMVQSMGAEPIAQEPQAENQASDPEPEPRRERRRDQRYTPPPIVMPELRPAAAVTAELFEFTQTHRQDPTALERYLAEQPELFNIDIKLQVSLELVQRWVEAERIAEPLQPVLIRFFEWDTFTEQRRLAKRFSLMPRLRFLLACADMRNYLEHPPAGKDKDDTRRILRRLSKAGAGFGSWLSVWLHPFGDKEVGTAFKAADRRFSEPVVSAVLGAKLRRFWNQILSPTPNLTQGAVLFTRLALFTLAASLVLFISILQQEPADQLGLLAAITVGVCSVLPMLIMGRWLLNALYQGFKAKLMPQLARGIARVDLINRRRLFPALILAATAAIIWWPAAWTGAYVSLAVFALLLLAVPDLAAFLGLVCTTLGAWIILAAWEPQRLLLYATGWSLAYLYVVWLSYWTRWLLLRRQPQSKATLGGAIFAMGGLFFVVAIVILNLSNHK